MKKEFALKKGFATLRQGFGILALALSATLSGCEQMNGSCGDIEPAILTCNTEVTVVAAGCASGLFQNRWLQLANGDLLQPYENQTAINSLQIGQRYQIGYETMPRDNRFDGQLICQALPPNGTPVRLLCITPLKEPTENCTTLVTAKYVECSFGAWGNIWLQLEDGRYLQPWNNGTSTTQLTAGAKYTISYTPMAKDNRFQNGTVCAAMPSDPLAWTPEVVSVDCLQPANSPK